MNDSAPTTPRSGKPPKFRASCDSCSASKIRCSQTRPSCARCIKTGVPCVYGISQRSGKRSAGSYYARKQPAAFQLPTPPGSDAESLKSTDSAQFTDASISTPVDLSDNSDFPDLLQQQFKTEPFDQIFLPNNDLDCQDTSLYFGLQSVFGSDDAQVLSQQHQPGHLSHQSPEVSMHSNANESIHSSRTVSTPNFYAEDLLGYPDIPNSYLKQDDNLEHFCYSTPSVDCSARATNCQSLLLPTVEDCRCNEFMITQLSSLPVLLGSERCNIDMELAQFQKAIRLCTSALACTCAGKDYTSVLTIAMLVARIISVFERSSQSRGFEEDANSTDYFNRNGATGLARCSSFMYQMDQEDENSLKEKVWWLQAQKVESLLAGFRRLIRKVKHQELCPDVTQGAAWEKLHLLLDRKVQAVKTEWVARRVTS